MNHIINCQNCSHGFLINLLEAGVPAVCPSCGLTYRIAKHVANSDRFSPEVKEVAAVVCGFLLVFAGALYLDKIIDSLRG